MSHGQFEFLLIFKIFMIPLHIYLGFNKTYVIFAMEGITGFYLFINVLLSRGRSTGVSLPWIENSRSAHSEGLMLRRGRQRMRLAPSTQWNEFEQTLGDNEGQGSLACCSPWGRKESDMTERLNNNIPCCLCAWWGMCQGQRAGLIDLRSEAQEN